MILEDEMKEVLNAFIIESEELLQTMEDCLLGLEDNDEPGESINAIFRAAHTIKGSSGLFGLDHIVRFTHVVESVLDRVREGEVPVSPELVAVLLPCCDHMGLLIQAIASGQLDEDVELTAAGEQLLTELRPLLTGKATAAPVVHAPAYPVVNNNLTVETVGGNVNMERGNWHLSLRFSADCLRSGMDPLAFIRFLSTLGEVVHMTTISETMPPIEEMDPETNYLGFEIDLKSDADKQTIENVFEFVREDSQIIILPLASKTSDFIELIESLPENNLFLGEILVKSGVITQRELDEGLKLQQALTEDDHKTPPLGEILVEQKAVQQPVVNAALNKQKLIKDNKAKENQSIRVDAERLDKLLDLVGELVISGAGVNLRALQVGDQGLLEAMSEVMRLVEEVRDSALQLRMVPIGTTFSRFQRVVRDVSKELGKDIELVITGGETEVDKSVVEKIADPLMHLVRNSMDHGIETADIRVENNKPARGTLRLNAYHESGTIAIEVIDDGGGINRDRILEKAIEKGMVQPNTNLTDQEVFALIFEPGFSTAQQVSNISGRGVGMDVVKRNVNDLRGTIEIESELGAGTTMRIRLPLTLAIIEGFLVGVGHSSFVIPLDRVVECVELPVGTTHCDYMDLRGEVLPFVRLRPLFEIEGEPPRRENVVVVEYNGVKTGLIVDRLLGEFQTVIKPLGKLFQYIRGVAGSTILGNGKVALILDVSSLVSYVHQRDAHHNHVPGANQALIEHDY